MQLNRRIVLIIVIIGMLVLAAGFGAWFLLRPAMEAQTAADPAYNDAWKLERIQGSWASEDEKYELSIDGYDFTLQVNGVFAVVASLQFDASEEFHEDNVRFTLQIDPASAIYPDVQGAAHYAIDALWFEDGSIYMRLAGGEGAAAAPVCLFSIEPPPPAWPLN